MRRLLQLFRPQRADAAAIVVGMFAVLLSSCIAIHGFERLQILQAILMIAVFTLYVVGAAAGCQQVSIGRATILVIALTLAYGVGAIVTHKDNPLEDRAKFITPLSMPLVSIMYLWLFPLIGLTSYALHRLLGFVAKRISDQFSSFKGEGQSRSRWLIGLALMVFLIFQFLQHGPSVMSSINAVAIGILTVFYSYWISDTMTGTWSWLKVSIIFLATAVVVFTLIVGQSQHVELSAVLGFIVLALCATGSGSSRHQTPPEPPKSKPQAGLPGLQTSFWGFVLLLVSMGLSTIPWVVSLPVFFAFSPTRFDFWNSLEQARQVKSFERETESRFSIQSGNVIEFDFARFSSPEALMKVHRYLKREQQGLPLPWAHLHLKNLHSGVKTNSQISKLGFLRLERGQVQAKQLEDLAAITTRLFISDLNVQASDPALLKSGQVELSDMSAAQLRSFFDAVDERSSALFIYVRPATTAETWPVLAEASRQLLVHCQIDWDEETLNKFPRVPAKNLTVRFVQPIQLNALMRAPAFCDSNIDLFGIFSPEASLLEAKLLLRGECFMLDSPNTYASISNWKNDQLFVYERDEKENPLGLLCPLPFDDNPFSTSGLEHLKTLTFDMKWFEPGKVITVGTQTLRILRPEVFAGLPKLERLVFPSHFRIADLGFLVELPNLKKLEIQLALANTEQYSNLLKLKALEHLTLLDEPPDELLEVLAKMKRLKQLTIVLRKSFGTTDLLQKSVEKFLPDIQVALVEEHEYQPDIPDSFKQHFSRVIEELKAKFAAGEKEKNPD